jgi:hypothetical protein
MQDTARRGLFEIPEEDAEMGFNEGGGAGEVGPMLVKYRRCRSSVGLGDREAGLDARGR